ncbi:hypothetical protein DH2020_005561 [Rehmannia glutinosa]|uniref:F-box domain-containing protein n=1 Tax=Rehmannia glutinosa TaxID=99300 RepID=A0ABR0XGF2_REHGL
MPSSFTHQRKKRKSDTKTHSNWRDLPLGLLADIAKRVSSIHDYLSFRGVCTSWRSAATFDNFDKALPRVPWLMYAEEKNVKRVANFFDLTNNKTYNITTNFPPPHDKKLLIVVWRMDPLCFGGHRTPTMKGDLVVMVIWGKNNQLGFSRPGDSSWSVMDTWDGSFSDIIYRNGRLYAVDFSRKVVECDIHGPNPSQIVQVFSFPNLDYLYSSASSTVFYLVESSSGELLIVHRQIFNSKTIWFEVFEIDLKNGSHKRSHGLPNKAVFVGCNSSLCVEVCDWDRNVVKPNCIYFTGRVKDSDRGVCCLLDMSFEGLPVSDEGVVLWDNSCLQVSSSCFRCVGWTLDFIGTTLTKAFSHGFEEEAFGASLPNACIGEMVKQLNKIFRLCGSLALIDTLLAIVANVRGTAIASFNCEL